jgi:hypothetical protein
VGDQKRLRQMDRRNTCLHESAHSVVRQLKIGNLAEVGVVRRGASYSHPAERRPFNEMSREELAKVAVVVAAGIFAESELCYRVGDQEHAVEDDKRQWEGIQRLGEFSDEKMQAFRDEAAALVRSQESAIQVVARELDRRRRLTGEQVTRLMKVGTAR